MSQEKTLVVILCMHRCGSSLTARLLQRLGMSLGPFDLGEANESNKYGHFEAQPFVFLNREFQLRQFGFEGDLPDDAETLRRYCQCDGRWTSATSPTADRDPRPATRARVPRCPGAPVPGCPTVPAVSDDPGYVVPEIPEEAIARGRDLVGRLMESGTVCGFKDPRTVQVWPYWQRVFAGLPELRVVPLFLVRGPHEIAMSIFRRSQGDRDYAQALDVTAVHFRRMKDICDQWSGPWCVVQFDPQVCGLQLRRAAELCGLNWSDSAFAEVYDASCRHHEAAVVDHPAQAAFEALAGPGSSRRSAGNDRQLLADAAIREATLRQRRDLRRQERDTARQERDAARWEVAALQHENASLRQTVATIPPLQARLEQTTYDLNLIQNSRTWRAREALANVMRFGRAATHDPEYQAPRPPCPGNADQEIHSKPRPDPQAGAPQADHDHAPMVAVGLHYCERKDHAST